MASSGWQGQKNVQTSVYPHMALNLRVDSISHSGTTLTVKGIVRVVCTSGYISYNGATVSLTGGGSKTINLNLNSSGTTSADTGTFTCTISNVSATTTSKAVTATLSAGSVASGSASWTLTFDPSTSAPTGLYINNITSTWDSVSGTVGLSSYGVGSGTKELTMLVLTQPYVAGLPHRWDRTTSGALSYNATVNNNSTAAAAGAVDIKGAGTYYTGVYVSNGSEVARYAGSSIATPPSSLQSITYSATQGSTNVAISITITGGTSANNNSNTVTTYYRYSTNGGSSYSSWISAGTGTTWTAKTASFTCNYGASVVVQAKQTYSGKDSEVRQITFTAPNGTAPSGGSVTVTDSTWNTVSLSASGVSYGNPSSISGRSITFGVKATTAASSNNRVSTASNTTSSTATLTNSSSTTTSALTLKGMLPFYVFMIANNTVQSATVVASTTTQYLPPAPGVCSYTNDGDALYTVSYTGVAANNVTDYTASDLTRNVRYKIDNGAWVYIDNAAVKTVTTVTSQQITVPYQSTATVEAWMSYKGKNSQVSTVSITNTNNPVHLYGSVSGQAKEIEHLYGSVNGQAVKIKKLYASVDGVAKKIFEDTGE